MTPSHLSPVADKLEPAAAAILAGAPLSETALVSIAVSLKRLADRIDKNSVVLAHQNGAFRTYG